MEDTEHPLVTENGAPLIPPTSLDGDDSPWKWSVTSYYGLRCHDEQILGDICSETLHLDDRTKDAEVRSQASLPHVGKVKVRFIPEATEEIVYSEESN